MTSEFYIIAYPVLTTLQLIRIFMWDKLTQVSFIHHFFIWMGELCIANFQIAVVKQLSPSDPSEGSELLHSYTILLYASWLVGGVR